MSAVLINFTSFFSLTTTAIISITIVYNHPEHN